MRDPVDIDTDRYLKRQEEQTRAEERAEREAEAAMDYLCGDDVYNGVCDLNADGLDKIAEALRAKDFAEAGRLLHQAVYDALVEDNLPREYQGERDRPFMFSRQAD